MAWLTIRFGRSASTQLVLQKGEQVFLGFFSVLFRNGINDMSEVVEKIEAYGIVKMLETEQGFYAANRAALGQGLIAVMRYALKDVNKNLFTGDMSFLNVGARMGSER